MTEPIAPIENDSPPPTETEKTHLPRITITYCTQCKWMLRAAYFAQELLSTFGTTLGEVSLRPATGGLFTVTIVPDTSTQETLLWDRKRDGGFPEVKQLKALVRNIVDPTRNLGHVDRALNKEKKEEGVASVEGKEAKPKSTVEQHQVVVEEEANPPPKSQEACEDCQ